MFKFDKLVFGDHGWGDEFLFATLMTITVSILSMGLGLCLAILTVWAKLITNKIARLIANFYTTVVRGCLLYTSPSPRDATLSRMPSSA